MQNQLAIRIYTAFLVVGGLTFLFITALQYPLSTTFPAGGDAAVHVRIVTSTPDQMWSNWYPGSYALFSIMHLVPFLDWPMRFVWFMALGQIATGLALGALLYRLSGPRAAAAAMAIWALTPIALTPFFEDATMAQLWSLPWLLLFFERTAARSIWGAALALGLTLFTHPISGLVLIATLGMASPLLFLVRRHVQGADRRLINAILIFSGGALAMAFKVLPVKSQILTLAFTPGSNHYLGELIGSQLRAWPVAAALGALIFATKLRRQPVIITILSCFFLISWLLSINDHLGIGLWTKRLMPYFALSITILAALGFNYALKHAVRPKLLQPAVFALIFLPLTLHAWSLNAKIYNRYESSSRYARLHVEEQAALSWIDDNLSAPCEFHTTGPNRHFEWIPALTDCQLIVRGSIDYEALGQAESTTDNSYLIFFTHTEGVPKELQNSPLPIVFENPSAVIYGPL